MYVRMYVNSKKSIRTYTFMYSDILTKFLWMGPLGLTSVPYGSSTTLLVYNVIVHTYVRMYMYVLVNYNMCIRRQGFQWLLDMYTCWMDGCTLNVDGLIDVWMD